MFLLAGQTGIHVIDIPRVLAGLVLSTLIGAAAYHRRSLTRSGWLGAILTGTLTFGFGGWTWGGTLIAFFLSSSALTQVKKQRKQQLAGEKFEKGGQRDFSQTMANGGVGALLALLYGLTGEPALLALFTGVMATVTADTWATELGVLARGEPRLITTLRPVAPGTSGGVSAAGVLASAAGALLIGVCVLLLFRIEHSAWLSSIVVVALIGGVAGSLADSLLGATVQAIYRDAHGNETERAFDHHGRAVQLRGWRWMTNDFVNALSSVAGGLIALGLERIFR